MGTFIKIILLISIISSLSIAKNINLYNLKKFGVAGKYTAKIDSFATDTILLKVHYNYLFYPREKKEKAPALFFYPKYNTTGPEEYLHLIKHIVSRGFAVVFPASLPFRYRENRIKKESANLPFFEKNIKPYKKFIDTTKIGFLGHNFGAGMLPSLARKVIIEKKWGTKAFFLYLMSPWYFHEITKRELSIFPNQTYLLVQVFEEDNVNDPKIASKLFENIGIPFEQKEFIITRSGNSKGMFNKIKADNLVPLSGNTFLGKEDILDTMGIFSLFDIISEASLNNNETAVNFIKGSNDSSLVHLSFKDSIVSPMLKTDYPDKFIKRGPYLNPWITPRNPYTSITEFRKGRKLIMKHYKEKIEKIIKFVKINRKKEKGELESAEILINPIDTGYGAEGPYKMIQDSLKSPMFEDSYIRFFYPDSIEGKIPVVILVHGYSGPVYQLFRPFIDHIVSRGTAVLFPPYPNLPLVSKPADVLEKQAIIKNGIIFGMNHFSHKIDSTRLAFAGHSFGAGQIPALSYWSFEKMNWGSNGKFLFLTAPWYISGIDNKKLADYPKNTKLLTIVFDDDRTNDHEIGADFFRSISISKEDKDFVTIFTDSIFEYKMTANHFVPYGVYSPYGEENFHDYYGIYKLFDALLDHSFNKNEKARIIALGNNSDQQTYLGEFTKDHPIRRMSVTDDPIVQRSQFEYFYTWENPLNPRRGKKRAFMEKVKKKIEMRKQN